jgi:hypothetical protein
MRISDFSKCFKYCESSPSRLVRLTAWTTGRNHSATLADVGSCVGYKSNNGYWVTELGGLHYKCHIIIVRLFGYDIPKGHHVDHIDQDKSNNLISNLRVVPRAINVRNQKMRNTNKSGVTGVCIKSKGGKPINYVACWKNHITGKQSSKSFPITPRGFLDAELYRCLMITQLNAEGAGYTEGHGK